MNQMPVYDEFHTPQEMRVQCEAAVVALTDARPDHRELEQAVRAALRPAPSIAFAAFPAEVPKPTIDVSLAAKHLADSLHLHLD